MGCEQSYHDRGEYAEALKYPLLSLERKPALETHFFYRMIRGYLTRYDATASSSVERMGV